MRTYCAICDANRPPFSIAISSYIFIRFSIHRILLTKASKYFATLLDANFQKANNIELILDDADGETIQMVVNYCGTGKTNLTVENVDKVMAISLDFELDLLQENCRQFYVDNLSVAKAMEILNDQNFNIEGMRERALEIACESFESLPVAEIRKMDHRLLEKLLECNTVNATEEMIFTRLYDWFLHSTGEREEHMPKLLKLIRLQHIPTQVNFCTNLRAQLAFYLLFSHIRSF